MVSIRKRPNGKYQAAIYLGKGDDGKRKMKFITRDTLLDCRRAAKEIENTRGE